ncbi:MAG: hypothetical protein JOS17DRAFT_415261 [Linnemannia elongata]|nr:MAG: hypothetical protein JOS17DRAFT_415261 [Linnemannia elongata]
MSCPTKTNALSVSLHSFLASYLLPYRCQSRCHSGTRPYICRFDGCDRAFTQLGNLKTHERKHTGERPYKCPHPDCDKTFTQLGNLKTHERIHDEVKPFMCRLPGCGKTFSQLGNLKVCFSSTMFIQAHNYCIFYFLFFRHLYLMILFDVMFNLE